jgi:ascorbate PTS system EIIA or EIIAB component
LIAFGEGSLAVAVAATDRESAIRASGELLVASARCTREYVDQMVAAVEEFGPYIVIAPGIALAHARPSDAVLQTGLSLAVLAEPIEFGSHNDPVRLVFGLAAKDHDGHMEVLAALAERLTDEDFVNALLNAPTTAELVGLLQSRTAE